MSTTNIHAVIKEANEQVKANQIAAEKAFLEQLEIELTTFIQKNWKNEITPVKVCILVSKAGVVFTNSRPSSDVKYKRKCIHFDDQITNQTAIIEWIKSLGAKQCPNPDAFTLEA